ncbi:ribosomal RNA small subunit methyltransferase B, putative [Medicago truncatula]|uniref:Ribosomal RNA small subunit methyltransferase B, putative n=1 Tax=Medicago truncatula TaxID=3880 RepID=G7K4K2_MEDTR|nr:ribosomal RNA small subunit methyltransferase B, putative [Medicago truncatula]
MANVHLAKAALRLGADHMVNGIIRKPVVLRFYFLHITYPENEMFPLPKVHALETLYSHPVWVVRRWTKYLGQEETVNLTIWNNSEPIYSLRLVNDSSIVCAHS